MFSFSFPNWEIHQSKEPVAIIMFPSRKQKEYKLRVLSGKYFYVIDGKKFQGIFELDPTKCYYSKNTPVYYFDSRNCLPFDWEIGAELVKFAKTSKLTKITQKDTTHSKMLRDIIKGIPDPMMALKTLQDKVAGRKTEIKETLDEFNKKIRETPPEQQLDEKTMGYILTKYLLQKNLITPDEKGMLDAQIDRGEMTLDSLISELRDKEIVSITQPFSRQEELYLENYGGYNPSQLSSFLDRLRQADRGLKTMTSVPIKQWIPAGVIMALLVGGSIAVIVLLNNMDGFSQLVPDFGPPATTPAPPPELETTIPEPPAVPNLDKLLPPNP